MDVMGKALMEYHRKGKADTVVLHNSYGEAEEMPVDLFFREEAEMPFIELKAIELCRGKILDVGAGAGSHALLLQDIGKDVTALEISAAAAGIMRERGVHNVIHDDLFQLNDKTFDTLLFLMNGIGLTGTLDGFKQFLSTAHHLVNPGGQLIFDSSDISYLYEDEVKPTDVYFGEVSYCYEYKGEMGEWFNWVYVDQDTLKESALAAGWSSEVVWDDGEDQYLARLVRI